MRPIKLGEISRLAKHQLRHDLQVLHSEALETRDAVLHDDLNARGLVADLDRMIATLTGHRDVIAREIRTIDTLEATRSGAVPPGWRLECPLCHAADDGKHTAGCKGIAIPRRITDGEVPERAECMGTVPHAEHTFNGGAYCPGFGDMENTTGEQAG